MFLVAYYYQRPSNNRVRTAKAGWKDQPGAVAYDEQVALSIKLKSKDLTMAKIILDLRARKIVRNGWNSESDYDQLFGYFKENYPKYRELMDSVNTAVTRKTESAPMIAPSDNIRVIDTSNL